MSATPPTRPRRYFGFHYRMLRLLGLGWWHHPDQDRTDNFPSWYLPYSVITMLLWVAGFVGLETLDPFTGDKDMSRFMFSLSFVITHNLTIIKLYLFFFRNQELQETVSTIEVRLYNFYQSDIRNRATIRATRILTAAYLIVGCATIANSTINGAVQDFQWRSEVAKLNATDPRPERTLPQPVYIPWNYQEDGPFITAFTLEAVGLLWTGHIVMIIDTFIGSLLLHISGQFATLQEAFRTLYERAIADLIDHKTISQELMSEERHRFWTLDEQEEFVNGLYSKEEIDKAMETKLVNCIKQHQLLISCVEKFSAAYAYGFLTQLVSSLAAICVIMVQVSKDVSSFKSIQFATSLAFFFTMIMQLAIQCFTANDVTLEAQKVSGAAAEARWERMRPALRRHLLPVMTRAQRPLHLRAAGFANMNNSCFLRIVKAAYSYYAVISQQEENNR